LHLHLDLLACTAAEEANLTRTQPKGLRAGSGCLHGGNSNEFESPCRVAWLINNAFARIPPPTRTNGPRRPEGELRSISMHVTPRSKLTLHLLHGVCAAGGGGGSRRPGLCQRGQDLCDGGTRERPRAAGPSRCDPAKGARDARCLLLPSDPGSGDPPRLYDHLCFTCIRSLHQMAKRAARP
jgi:hypothetical protein